MLVHSALARKKEDVIMGPSSNTGLKSGRRLRTVVIVGLFCTMLLLLALTGLHALGGTLHTQDSGALMNELIKESGLNPRHVGQDHVLEADDGNVPSETSRALSAPQPADEVIRMLVGACGKVELSAPQAVELRTDPDMKCSGFWKGRYATIRIARCERECTVTLTTSVI